MADYAISNVPRRVVYAPSGVGPYAFTFEILNQTDIAVYRGSTLLTLTTDYTVTINLNGTGSVTLVATAGTSNITIVGAKNIQRTSDFTTGGDLFANTLNDELDNQTIFIQQVAETAERGLKAPVTDPTDIAMTLPSRDGRKGKVLAFDSTTGNPVAGPALDAVVTVIEQSANINTVAANIGSVNTVAGNTSNINTVAGVSGNVTTVATNIANVNAVGADLLEPISEINTVAVDIANVNTVGNNIGNVNTVAGNNANVSTVAGISGNVTTVAGISGAVSNVSSISSAVSGVNSNATNINTVAGQITPTNNVSTVAGISANVSTVAGISASVTSVAGNASNINTVAGISSNVTTVATNNANVTTVAGSIASVNTNATNIANINQNAANIVAIQNASANATAAAASALSASGSATSASASAAAASAVALGNEPVRHSIRPSLLLDFANTKTLDPRITFTRASTATYFDDKGVMQTAAAGVARFEHNPVTGESLGLEIEEQRTNLLTYSDDFANAAWLNITSSEQANVIISPDGALTGDKLVVDNAQALGSSYIYQLVTKAASATTYTQTVYAKLGELNRCNLFIHDNANSGNRATVTFSLVDGSITTAAAVLGTFTNASASSTSVGNGWYRLSLTFTSSTETTLRVRIYSLDSTATNGNGFSGVYIWGAQLEAGAFATSYIPTVASQVTRSADSASMTGTNFSSWYRADEGSLYANYLGSSGNLSRRICSLNDNTITNVIHLVASTSTGAVSNYGEVVVNSVIQASLGSGAYSATEQFSSFAYKVNDFAFSKNGASALTDTLGTIPIVSQFEIGQTMGVYLNGTIKKIAYYPKRLTNAELQGLTTV